MRPEDAEKSTPPTRRAWLVARLVAVLALGAFDAVSGVASGVVAQDPRAPIIEAVTRAEQAIAAGELEIAESAFRDAAREGWMYLGRLQLTSGVLDAAEVSFRHALRASVIAREPTMSLALLHARRSEHEAAQALLFELIARNPADGAARRLLAQTLVSSGEIEAAVLELEEGWAADPRDLETAFALATGYLRVERFERAKELFELLAERRPLPETHVLVGRMYRDFGRYDEATRWLEGALEKDPQVRRARYYLGTVTLLRVGMGGLDRAIEYFEAELDLSPGAETSGASPTADPMTELYLGSALVEDRQLERALPLLERAAAWPPAAFDAERYRGRALLALGRTEEALEWLERAFEKRRYGSNRDLSELHYQLGTAKRSVGSVDEAKEHFALAKELGRELTARQRERFTAFVRDDVARASSRKDTLVDPLTFDPFEAGDDSLAKMGGAERSELERGVRHLLAQASMNLGVLDARQRRFERAAEHFERASEADAELEDLDRSLAMAHFQAGRFERAIAPLERALESAPEAQKAPLRRTLAVAQLNVGHYDATIELLADDAERETKPALQFAYAVALVRSGRTAEAAPLFEELTASGDEWPALRVVLGQSRAREGDFDAAEAELLRALELDPRAPDARESLGEIYLRLGRLGDAAEVLAKELEIRPGNLDVRYLLATVLDLDRQPAEAERHLRRLLRAAPEHGDARYLLGKILLAGGDAASAIEQLRAAAELSPEDANVHYQLGQAYQRDGRSEEAKRHFDIFRRLKDAGRGAS